MNSFLSLKNIYLRYAGIVLAMVYILIEAHQNNDFNIFLSASSDIVHHINAYGIFYKGCYHYYYSLLFAVVLFPLTLLPDYVSKVIWLFCNLLFIFRTWKSLSFFVDRSIFTEAQKLYFTLLSFCFVLYFLKENFHCGQMTVFILFLSMEGIYRIMSGRYWVGAILISLAINIKLLPIAFIPYLFFRGYLKAFGLLCAFFVLWLFLPAFVLGFEFNNVLLRQWYDLLNPANPEHIIDTSARSLHSITSWLPTLLMDHCPDPAVLKLKRNILNLDEGTVETIINVIRGALILFFLYFLRSLAFVHARNKLYALWEISYMLLLVPLIFPHQQHYAFYFMLPSGTYLLYYLGAQAVAKEKTLSKRKFRLLFAGWILVFLTNNLQVLLGEFGAYYEHFKTITYGALLMVFLLAWARPAEIPIPKKEELDPAPTPN